MSVVNTREPQATRLPEFSLKAVGTRLLGEAHAQRNPDWHDLHEVAVVESESWVSAVLVERSYRGRSAELDACTNAAYRTGEYILAMYAQLGTSATDEALGTENGKYAALLVEEIKSRDLDQLTEPEATQAVMSPWYWVSSGLAKVDEPDSEEGRQLDRLVLQRCRDARFDHNFLVALIASMSVSFDTVLRTTKGLDGLELALSEQNEPGKRRPRRKRRGGGSKASPRRTGGGAAAEATEG